MRRSLKIMAIFLVMLLLVSGCTNENLNTKDAEINISIIVKKKDHEFWAVVEMGAEAASKEFGVNIDFDGPLNEKDIDIQIGMVEEVINSDTDALVLAAGDFTKLVPVAEKVKALGIPVIIIDSNIDSDRMNSFIGTDNVDAGKQLGHALINEVGKKCKVVVMSFVKGAATANEREAGFLSTISAYPDIEVVDTVYCNSEDKTAERLTKELVRDHKDIDAFVCLNAYGTIGTARAIHEWRKDIKVIGFDSAPEEISYLEKGVIQTLVVQNPFSMGYLGVKHAVDALNGNPIPKVVKTESKMIDIDNMYLPENQKLLFPFVD